MSRQKHPFSKQIIDSVRQYATKERKLRPHPRPFAGNFSAVFPHKIRGFAAFAPRAADPPRAGTEDLRPRAAGRGIRAKRGQTFLCAQRARFLPPPRGGLRPAGAKLSLAALCAELPRPRQGRSPSVREPCFPAVLGSQPPRRLCRQPPLHKGALYGAAALSRPALAFCGGERYNHLL